VQLEQQEFFFSSGANYHIKYGITCGVKFLFGASRDNPTVSIPRLSGIAF